MKKLIAIFVICAIALSLASCSIPFLNSKDQGNESSSSSTSGSGILNSVLGLFGGLLSNNDSENGNSTGNTENTSGLVGKISLSSDNNTKKVDKSKLTGYMERLADEWNNQDEVGYVWTITLNDAAEMKALGLVGCHYNMNVSCSHVGETPFGVYRGSMGFCAEADYGGLGSLFSAIGGGFSADNTGWFRNDNFLMNLVEYKEEDEELFKATLGEAGESEEANEISDAIGDLIMGVNGAAEMKENTSKLLGYWCDWEMRMTEGDMDQKASAFLYGGLVNAHASVSNEGHDISGNATASIPFVGTFHELLDEIEDGPFPYQVKFYEDGEVTIDLFGTGSSTVFVRFTGTWDKIPVEDTIKPAN